MASDVWASNASRLVLKEGDIFIVSDERGNIGLGQRLGLYYNDTRYLSIYDLKLNGQAPTLLSSSSEQNFMANLQFTNPPLELENGETIVPHTISLRRNRFVNKGVRERIGMYNYNRQPTHVTLSLTLGGDFRDMFDVRGYTRAARGKLHPPDWNGQLLTLSYTGLDELERLVRISFDPPPNRIEILTSAEEQTTRLGAVLPEAVETTLEQVVLPPLVQLNWDVDLQPVTPWSVTLFMAPEGPAEPAPSPQFDEEARSLRQEYTRWNTNWVAKTDNEVVNRLLLRSLTDLRVLMKHVDGGMLPVAGIPWFAVPFGRDSLITALQTLVFRPDIAIGTLRFLAEYQGQRVDPWRDEQPGKILHELRSGEMARLNEIPHAPYYGTIDATPLWLLLFAETLRWTDDDKLYEDLLPNALAALRWVDEYGDLDGDGYIEYATQTQAGSGLQNQGWKDSKDSLQWPDGSYAVQPIALAEVQGYVYAAKNMLAEIFAEHGEEQLAERLRREAADLKQRFNRDFWVESINFYAQALDGEKKPVPTISSNVGQALYCGIIAEERIPGVVAALMADDMSCGWGIRTVSSHHPSFNPMSYHNGSVWPHDTAIIAAGLTRLGYAAEANRIFADVLDAAQHFRYLRLPEVYCGFARDLRYYNIPAEYPVACSPQAWAAGTMIHFFQTMLGLQVDASHRHVKLHPQLPPQINNVELFNLQVGRYTLDLMLTRNTDNSIATHVLRNPGQLKVEIIGTDSV